MAGKSSDGLARTSRGASAVHEKATSKTTTAVAVAFESFVAGWGEVEVERHSCGEEAVGGAGGSRYASAIG